MAVFFEWRAPGAVTPIRFAGAPYILRDFDGVGPTGTEPQTQKSPFQIGSSLINTDISSRTVSIQLRIIPEVGGRNLEQLRADLVKSLSINPSYNEEDPEVGSLRIYRTGLEPLELLCVPRDSPQFTNDISNKFCDADLEFFAADPMWRDIEETKVLIGMGEGTGFPIELPFELSGTVTEAVIFNDGDVPVPITATINGELTTVRLINDTIAQTMEVTGLIPAGESLRIKTHFGAKEVTAIGATGTETSAMARINLDLFDFWQLQRGENIIRLEADTAAGGTAELRWRNRYAGV
jgi:Phage tail protein